METKDIKGHEGLYKIDRLGNIYSIKRKRSDGSFVGGKALAVRTGSNGYKRTTLCNAGKESVVMVHRLLAIAWIDNPKALAAVNHIDGDKLNNSLSNLEWVSVGENNRHALEKGLRKLPKGETHSNSVLTESDVLEIRKLYPTIKQKELAARFGVCQQSVSDILNGKKWTHI